MEHEAFNFLKVIPGLKAFPEHVAGSLLVAAILVIFSIFARIALKRQGNALVPPKQLSFFHFCDIVVEGIYKMSENTLGEDTEFYLPIIGTLFLYIFLSNLLGLLPGFSPPTDNVNTNLACGVFVYVYYNYRGFRAAGIGYLKHFLGPVWYMAWLLLPIEFISHAVRPFTLALRLKGNMTGDHTVLSVFTSLSPYVVPVPAYFLGLLTCFLQAFIFVMLTMVYIAMARDSDHH